jgi:hypothetical protein
MAVASVARQEKRTPASSQTRSCLPVVCELSTCVVLESGYRNPHGCRPAVVIVVLVVVATPGPGPRRPCHRAPGCRDERGKEGG